MTAVLEGVDELLRRRAAERPGAAAIVSRGKTLSFAELDALVDRYAAGFAALGLSPGERVALLVPVSFDFVALTFALFRARLCPVLIDPGIGFSSMGQCLAEAKPVAFVGSAKAHAARALGRWAKGSLRLHVGAWPGAVSFARLAELGQGSEPPQAAAPRLQAVLFTSGSTGAPKGAAYTPEMFAFQVERLRSLFAIEAGEVSVPTFPLFALFDVALGQTIVLPEMDFTRPADVDPRALCALIERHRAAQLFGSPALLDAVGRWGEEHDFKLGSLKRVLSAGAPVSPRILKRFKKLATCPIYTPYGATEALPVAVISADEVLTETAGGSALGKGTCVGKAVEGARVEIVKISDKPIPIWSDELRVPEGEVGELCVAGPMVSPLYVERPDQTALHKIAARTGELYHRTGDLGWRDERGRLWFVGRKSQRVEARGKTFHTVACEGIFNNHPLVKRSALVGVDAFGSRVAVLCVELEPAGKGQEARVRMELLELARRHEPSQDVAAVLFHPKFPVDIRHNAKIKREVLALWAKERLKP